MPTSTIVNTFKTKKMNNYATLLITSLTALNLSELNRLCRDFKPYLAQRRKDTEKSIFYHKKHEKDTK